MDSLISLNEVAEKQFEYVSFERLHRGRYHIKEFFMKEDNTYGPGQRLCLNFDNRYYVILPKRFTATTTSVNKLNSTPTDFIFGGKQSKYVINLSFAPADSTKCDEFSYTQQEE